ncbi:MAG: cytochrome c oxidase subunit I [Acidimicrobiales bacterium]
MTLLEERREEAVPEPEHTEQVSGILNWLTSTDHKVIGISYTVTSLGFFLFSGVLAEMIRTQLASPLNHFVDQHTYNQLFTMHGSIMMFLFVGPFAFGLGNFIIPLQIGAPEVSFPRLNALSYWLYLFGGLTMISGFLTVGGAADFGWYAYAPLNSATFSPGMGPNLWFIGIALAGIASVLTSVNFVTTIYTMRAPGMTMFRMPIFTWNMFVTAILVMLAFPVLTATFAMVLADRILGAHVFSVSGGGVPVMYQHLFWFFGHPEVYIAALPYFGMVTEVLPVFSRKPVFGYKGLVFATLSIAGLSMGVWAHHMYTTGVVLLPFFAGLSYLIAVPTGVKFFNWIGTMWRGELTFETPMLFAIGFLLVFLLGGLTGVLIASPPVDFALNDTFFIVAHFHYALFGTTVFGGMAGFYYWYPKMSGHKLNERLGKAHFWLMFVGFNVTFLPQFELGMMGMVRRIAWYYPGEGFTFLNQVSTAGAYVVAISMSVFLVNLWYSRNHSVAAAADPWDGHTLEWITSSPPPPKNFDRLIPVRSDAPLWDLKLAQQGIQPLPVHGRPKKQAPSGAGPGSTGGNGSGPTGVPAT